MRHHLLPLGLFLLLLASHARAQDPNWSLPYATPMLVNPAMTGLMEGDARIRAAHRLRRATPQDNFQTSLLQGEGRIYNRLMDGGFGGLVAHDNVPGLNTNHFLGSFAYELPFGNKVRYHHVRFGVQAGFTQRSIQNPDLFFEDQFDGTGFSGSTTELIQGDAELVGDASIGLMWYRTQKIRGNVEFNPFFGAALYHLNAPEFNFLESSAESSTRRLSFQGGGTLHTRSPLDLSLNLTWDFQNESDQATITMLGRYNFFENSMLFGKHKASVMAGTVLRTGDGILAYTGVEYRNTITFGFAFDVLTSDDRFIDNTYGGMHVMISYMFGHENYRDSALPLPLF